MFEIAQEAVTFFDTNQANGTSNTKPSNYNISDHINNVPVNLHVEDLPHGSTGAESSKSGKWESVEHKDQLTRSMSQTSEQPCTTCATSSNDNKIKPLQQDYNKKPNNNENKYCKVVIPDTGNFEVKIKRVKSNFAEMKLKANQTNQNFRQQKQPVGMQQNFNQNKQTGNQNIIQNFKEKSYDLKFNNKIKGHNNGRPKTQNENVPGFQYRGPKVNIQEAREIGCGNEQSTWMYLGRINKDTTEFDLQNCLEQKYPGYDFVVVQLPQYKDAKLPSFKVKVDNRILEEFKNPAHWPEGVKITKYMEYSKENGSGPQNRGPKVNFQKAQGVGCESEQSTWMYLGRTSKEIERLYSMFSSYADVMGYVESDLQNYLRLKFPGYDFVVVLLPRTKDAKIPSFKVKVDNRILEEFKNPANWPEGVKITKYMDYSKENGPGPQNRGPKVNFQKAQGVGCDSGQSTWMYLGRTSKEIERLYSMFSSYDDVMGYVESDLQNYLRQKFPGYDFVVVLLSRATDAKIPSFKVKVDIRILEEFKNPAYWPEGVIIRKYLEKPTREKPKDNGPGTQNREPKVNFQKALGVGCESGQSTWMYLGRINKGTTEFALHNYLQEKFPGYNFDVGLLPFYRDAKLPSFKVKVDNRILEEFKNPAHWPEGVKIIKYFENFKS